MTKSRVIQGESPLSRNRRAVTAIVVHNAISPPITAAVNTNQFVPVSWNRAMMAITNAICATTPPEIVVIHQSDRLARPCSDRMSFIFLQNAEALHPLPGAPLRCWLRFLAALRLRRGAGSGLPSAGLFCLVSIRAVRARLDDCRCNLLRLLAAARIDFESPVDSGPSLGAASLRIRKHPGRDLHLEWNLIPIPTLHSVNEHGIYRFGSDVGIVLLSVNDRSKMDKTPRTNK